MALVERMSEQFRFQFGVSAAPIGGMSQHQLVPAFPPLCESSVQQRLAAAPEWIQLKSLSAAASFAVPTTAVLRCHVRLLNRSTSLESTLGFSIVSVYRPARAYATWSNGQWNCALSAHDRLPIDGSVFVGEKNVRVELDVFQLAKILHLHSVLLALVEPSVQRTCECHAQTPAMPFLWSSLL